MKILIYSHYFPPSVGGAERLVQSMARGFIQKGHRVCVATQTAAGNFDDRTLPYPVVRQPGAAALVRLIREHEVVHLAGPSLLPMLLGYLLRKPVINEHHSYQAVCPNGLLVYQPDQTACPGHFVTGRHRQCLRCNAGLGRWTSFRMWMLGFPRLWFCRHAVFNVAISNHVRQRLSLPNTQMIYHGVPEEESVPALDAATAGHDSSVCFAYVGRFVKEKGLHVLIDAAALLKGEGLPFRLQLIGDGPERANLEAAVASRKLEDRTLFTGMLGPEELQQASVGFTALVMPSLCEEMCPLAPIEQMARGKILVVSDIGALAEIAGDASLKFQPGDSKGLATCMRRVIERPELVQQLGELARHRARALFTENSMLEAHLQLYRSLSAANHAPSGHRRLG